MRYTDYGVHCNAFCACTGCQAHAPHSYVVIVGTHLDHLDDTGRSKIADLHTLIYKEYSSQLGYPKIAGIQEVSCQPGKLENIETLKSHVYLVATEIKVRLDTSAGTLKENLVGRKVSHCDCWGDIMIAHAMLWFVGFSCL